MQVVNSNQNRSVLRWWLAFLVGIVAIPAMLQGTAFAPPLLFQPALGEEVEFKRAIAAPAAAPGDRTRAADAESEELADKIDKRFEGGAPLKTDPEQQRLLKRAEIFIADGRYDYASVLWQKVLDEAGDTLMTRNGQFYTSLSEEIERMIVTLPPEALRTYRLNADGQAAQLLSTATPDTEEDRLAEVVRRYFMSAAGDDAAYKLACLALDRYDFVGASRLLTKIIEQHPDPSMPKSEVLLRLSLACARMGDRNAAASWLTKYATTGGEKPSSEIFELVFADVTEAANTQLAGGKTTENWPAQLGGVARNGHMKSLPDEATARTLTESWVYQFTLATAEGTQQNPWGGMMGAMGLHGRPFNLPGRNITAVPRDPLVRQWRDNRWMPTAQLLFDKGLVIVKTADELAAFHAGAVSNDPAWLTFMKNEYTLDGQTADYARMQQHGVQVSSGKNEPRAAPEVFLFGDRVHQAMSLHNGVVYSIEGKMFGAESPRVPGMALLSKPWQWNVTPRRTRSNFLAAYLVSSGKMVGIRAASDEDPENSQDVGFLGAPIGFGNLVIAPVTDGGAIWLYAMEDARHAKDGKSMKTVWKTYLCDEPTTGSNPWATIVPALDGRDLYLCCGTGVVFNIDAVSGQVRWANRYVRAGRDDTRGRQYGMAQSRKIPLGFEDDVVIPHGRLLIVMASDSDEIQAIDRRTGEIAWTSPRTMRDEVEATYCLGISGEALYVAGPATVRALKLSGGKLMWEYPDPIKDKDVTVESYGHGALTEDALFIPVRDSIVKLDLEKGRDQGQVGVALPTDDPVGNIYSDGQKLWVAGAGRVYAMTTLEHRLTTLAQQIKDGDPEAQLTRMRLMFKDNKLDLALADLRGAYQLFRQKTDADEATTRLFQAMHELKLPQDQPLVALDLLREFFVADSPPPVSDEIKAKRADMLQNSLRIARQAKSPELTAITLKLASLLTTDHLIHSAAAAVQASATETDKDRLLAAVTGKDPNAQAIAVPAFVKVVGFDAKDPLSKLLGSADDRVKLTSARALANMGERESLQTFVSLLNSDNSRIRLRSHQALRALSGKTISFSPDAKPEERTKSIDEWKKWVETDGQTAKLTTPLPENDLPLGRTLFVSYGQSTVIELDADHKERWRTRVLNPWACQGLPNGNRLIAAFNQGQMSVMEFSEDGNEVWRKDRLPGIPYSVQRLENGNTLVACKDVSQIVEISPDGSTKSQNITGGPMYAQRLENGNTLVALNQGSRVIEIDSKQQTVWEARGMNGPSYCQRLDTGNTLIVQMHTGQVVEVDPTGRNTVWTSRVPLVNPYSAQRLANGNTLIADNNGVTEVDATGQQVKWRHSQNNVTGVSQF